MTYMLLLNCALKLVEEIILFSLILFRLYLLHVSFKKQNDMLRGLTF